MSLEHWDKEIRPVLDRITWGAMCVRTDAAMLRERPEWETITQGKLKAARKELEMALDRIRMAEAVYSGKPVMAEQAIVLEAAG